MDKRITMLTALYALHSKLIDVFHASSSDNQLLSNFCQQFIDFVQVINPKRSPVYFDHIFKPMPNFTVRAELNSHLLAASEYALIVTGRIKLEPLLDLGNETIAIIFDYVRLLQEFEKMNNLSIGSFAGNRNMTVDAYTSYKIATQFFWNPRTIQRSNTLNGYTIFALRQSLELAAKEIIGLTAIIDNTGAPDLYASQLPWQFIVDYQIRPYFNLPFQALQMQKIYKWTNHFVHTGNDAFCYVTALALTTVDKMYQNQKVTYWEGTEEWVYRNEIKDYYSLKMDFENYLAALPKPKLAKWASSAKLAYISG